MNSSLQNLIRTMNGGCNYDLNPVESFCLVFKYLWLPPDQLEKTNGSRAKLSIMDTLIFQDGAPFTWIFTSDKTGEVLKKRPERLNSYKSIVDAFTSRSKALKGHKEPAVKSKIAVIWYVQSNQTMSSYLVDSMELQTILRSELVEIVAIQVFMGGYTFNGNGIFEHNMWLDRKNCVIKGRTYEYISELDGGFKIAVMTNNSLKLETIDKRHEAMKNLVSRLNRHLESTMKCRIAQITIQAAFNFAGVPHILSWCEPQMPSYSVSSLLLPMKWSEHGDKRAATASVAKDKAEQVSASIPEQEATTGEENENPSAENPSANVTTAMSFVEGDAADGNNNNNDSSHKEIDHIFAELAMGNSFGSTNFTPSSSFNKLQRFNKTPVTRRSRNRATGAVDSIRQRSPAPISAVPTETSEMPNALSTLTGLYIPHHVTGKASSKINYENKDFHGSAHLPFQGTNTIIMKEEMRNQRMKGKTSMFNANLTTMHALSKSELDLIIEKSVAKFRPSTKEIDQTLLTSRSKEQLHEHKKTYLSSTENSAGKTLEGAVLQNLKDLLQQSQKAKELEKCRPTSAPLLASGADTESIELSAEVQPNKGRGVLKVMPLSGITCYGDHCDFANKIRSGQNGLDWNAEHKKKVKSKNCTHRVAYKSILLARADAKFLGFKIDDNLTETIWEKFKSDRIEFDQLNAYFVKWYISCLAKKCTEEAKKITIQPHDAPPANATWEDLNATYRNLVYCDALFGIHPSRFYYTVPVCELCFKMYSLMDVQRDLQVLNTPAVDEVQKSAPGYQTANEQVLLITRINTVGTYMEWWHQSEKGHNDFEIESSTAMRKDAMKAFDEGSELAMLRNGIDGGSANTRTRAFAKNVIAAHNKLINKSKDSRPKTASSSAYVAVDSSGRDYSSSNTVSSAADTAHIRNNNTDPRALIRRMPILAIPEVRKRVPLNHTNENNFDEFMDRGIGSRGPIHKDLAMRCTQQRGGSISSWVKLMGQKHSHTTDKVAKVRASSAVLSHKKYLEETSGGVFMTSRVDYGRMVNLEDAHRDRKEEQEQVALQRSPHTRSSDSGSPQKKVRPKSAHPSSVQRESPFQRSDTANLKRAQSYDNYPVRDSSQEVPAATASEADGGGGGDPPADKTKITPSRASIMSRQLSRPKFPEPSPYAFSSLPFMKAPLLRSATSTKTVQIADDSGDNEHASNTREVEREEEGQSSDEVTPDRERTIIGNDSRDVDGDHHTTDYLFSSSGQEQSLYYYRNQLNGDGLSNGLVVLNDDDLQAAVHLLEESVCTDTTRTPGGSIGEQTPIMAISPFDPHASPGSMYLAE